MSKVIAQTIKLICSVTGDWAYCTAERYEELRKKFGSKAKLEEGYESRAGKKLVESLMPSLPEDATEEVVSAAREKAKAQAIKQSKAAAGKNKIFCILTGERMYISPERMEKLMAANGQTEQEVRDGYKSRVAKRLEKELAESKFQITDLAELKPAQLKEIHKEIRQMAAEGKLPAPSAPKGSKKDAPKPAPKAKTKKSSKKGKKDETVVQDTVPAEATTDAVTA